MAKQTKVITKKRKFISVDVPLINSEIELVGENPEQIKGKTINLDLTRQLRGKSVEVTLKINIEKDKPIAEPIKINLMPYFIRRMIRKKISYIEDSIIIPTQESLIQVKPFIITRKPVSRAVKRTIRNLTKNWLEDYSAERKNKEIFEEILSNKMQKPLSLKLKKTYPLSLCEIRTLEVLRELRPEEIPKIKTTIKEKPKKVLDQLGEIEEQIKEKSEKSLDVLDAEKEIKKAQKKAAKIEEKTNIEENIKEVEKKPKKVSKKIKEE
jgi:ribosomal protein S3AE